MHGDAQIGDLRGARRSARVQQSGTSEYVPGCDWPRLSPDRGHIAPSAGRHTRKWSSARAKPLVASRVHRARTVKPSWRNKARRFAPDHVGDQFMPRLDIRRAASARSSPRNLALTRGHVLCFPSGHAAQLRRVAMRPAVNEHLDAQIGPAAQLCLIGRSLRQRCLAPMIGHHQHGGRGPPRCALSGRTGHRRQLPRAVRRRGSTPADAASCYATVCSITPRSGGAGRHPW